ncbi:MAG: ABC transporter permease [Kiritimatiellae bacterium]|nr:ABC transporter permease [Kiritimatiellia bacterium]
MESPSTTLALPPILNQSTVPNLIRGGAFALAQSERLVCVKGDDLQQCDGAGVAFLWTLQQSVVAAGGRIVWQAFPEHVAKQLAVYDAACAAAATDPEAQGRVALRENAITALGRQTWMLFSGLGEAIAFLGEVLFRLPFVFSKHFRSGDALSAFVRCGAEAVPVVGLIGFLLGLILAFQSAVPLQMFGAEGFVGGLVGIALVRELGLIITAILMAGRTASAFAAELGTMKVNEEIDALETMGISPVRFLVLPRIVAGTLALPILSLFATAAGLVGGWLVMHILGFSASYFVDQLQSFVSLKDLIGSECKAVVFGFTVATVGCWFGLKAGRDASAVGTATTAAVVTGIVLLATLEGIFSVIFYAMGW